MRTRWFYISPLCFAVLLICSSFPGISKARSCLYGYATSYRIDLGKEVSYALDFASSQKSLLPSFLAKTLKAAFKGLGEMNPLQLRGQRLILIRRLVQLRLMMKLSRNVGHDGYVTWPKRSEDRRNWLQEKGDEVDIEV